MNYWSIFWEMVRTPFTKADMVFGIVPVYFGWLLNEVTSRKANFQTAIQTGFAFVWSAAHWSWQYLYHRPFWSSKLDLNSLFAVNIIVTFLVFAIGFLAMVSGFRKKFPPYCSFLGHSRFANYFMIMIFPIQSRELDWSWDRLIAIVIFAVPLWALIHVGLMPWRKK
jgi:hypothetical protein